MLSSVPLLLALLAAAAESAYTHNHPQPHHINEETEFVPLREDSNPENDISYWRQKAQETVREKVARRTPLEGVAKNVILFLGDGMSITTITAARIFLGQLQNQSGEDSRLSFEHFPYTGLSKTYCVNKQVADSACSSTAYLGGVKSNYGTLGVTAAVTRGNCSLSNMADHHVDTMLVWAQAAGKATGLVTTTRITHASPGGNYAHTADRDWESDLDVATLGHYQQAEIGPGACEDIASQLVRLAPGKNCKVLLGGGRSKFIPANPMNSKWGEGERRDGRNLVDEWREDKRHRGKAEYVNDREHLLKVDVKHTDYLLGLFNKDHFLYHLDEEKGIEEQPTLEEMTEVAIRMLSKERRGFYLFVEGGKIDLAHHHNLAKKSLDETVEFHKAIQKAVEMTNKEETLIVVTADHAHTMTMAGYPKRGSDILGVSQNSDVDHMPYPTLSYANGPSAEVNRTGMRHNVTNDDFSHHNYRYPSLVGLIDETHGGEDVAVYARGPWAHLLTGTFEQTVIPHVMAWAAKIGPLGQTRLQEDVSSSAIVYPALTLILSSAALLLVTQ